MIPPGFSLIFSSDFPQISARSAPNQYAQRIQLLRDAVTRKSVTNRKGRALTRKRRSAKRNPHLASAQVNGGAALSMLRSLAGEGFRLGPNLRGFSGMAVRSGGAVRFRDSVSPNGMELPLSLARRLPMKRFKV